jgi:hypothetical protein
MYARWHRNRRTLASRIILSKSTSCSTLGFLERCVFAVKCAIFDSDGSSTRERATACRYDAEAFCARADVQFQLRFLCFGIAMRMERSVRIASSQDSLCFCYTRSQDGVSFPVVVLRGRGSLDRCEIVLEVSEVVHDLSDSHGARMINWEMKCQFLGSRARTVSCYMKQ